MYTSQTSISSGGLKTASSSSRSGKSRGGSKSASSSSRSGKKRTSRSDNSVCGSLPPLHEDTLYQEDKENAVTKMSAANIQHFWSTLSVHASGTVINIGGQATAALAVASSLLEDGEKMIRINEARRKQQRSYSSNCNSDGGSSSKKPKQEMRITPQTIHNAASKASIIILQKGAADSQAATEVASAVAVAIIEKGTELLNDMNDECDNEVIEFPAKGVLTARTTSSLTGSQKSSSSQRSDLSKADRYRNKMNDSTNDSMSTVIFKMWDKYATSKDKDSEGKRSTKETQAQSNRSFPGQQYPESCIASNSSERTSFDYSEHTDNTTIATESYHGLGPPNSNPYSDTLKKREEDLGRLLAAETEIIRQKGEALERGRAQFSNAADELQRKLEALQHQLDNIDAANSQTPDQVTSSKENDSISRNKSTDDTNSASRKVSAGSNSEEQESAASTDEPSQATGNNSEEQESAASTDEPSQASGNNSEEQESTTSTSEPSQIRSVLKKPTKVFRIVEDEKIHKPVELKETAVDGTCLISSNHSSVEEAFEAVLAKKTFKGRVKRVTWAAANTLCRIPGRTIKSAKKTVSRAFRRRGSVALTGLKKPLTRNHSSKRVEPPSTTDVPDSDSVARIRFRVLKMLQEHDPAKADRIDEVMDKFNGREDELLMKMIARYEGRSKSVSSDESSHRSVYECHTHDLSQKLANTCEMSTVRTPSSSQLSRRTPSSTSSHMDNSVWSSSRNSRTSSQNSMDFFDQDFYYGAGDSIDDETTDASLFTSYSIGMSTATEDDSVLLTPTYI